MGLVLLLPLVATSGHSHRFSAHSQIMKSPPLSSFFFFLAVPRSMQDLSSLTRDGTRAPLQWKHRVLTTGPPGNSPNFSFLELKCSVSCNSKNWQLPVMMKLLPSPSWLLLCADSRSEKTWFAWLCPLPLPAPPPANLSLTSCSLWPFQNWSQGKDKKK